MKTANVTFNDSLPVVHVHNTFSTQEMTKKLVSDSLRTIFQWIVFAVMNQLVDIFGTVANIINIICFVKQGFKDSVNISLLGNIMYINS